MTPNNSDWRGHPRNSQMWTMFKRICDQASFAKTCFWPCQWKKKRTTNWKETNCSCSKKHGGEFFPILDIIEMIQKFPCFIKMYTNYQTCAIISRSWIQTALHYVLKISRNWIYKVGWKKKLLSRPLRMSKLRKFFNLLLRWSKQIFDF